MKTKHKKHIPSYNRKRKKPSTSTSNMHKKVKKKRRIIRKVDMLSDLPNPIIHQILSHLPTKQAAKTSTLSKTWRNIWLSFPIIDLDVKNFFGNGYNIIESRMRLLEYMQRTLETRNLTYVQKLRIRSTHRIDQPSMQSLVDEYVALAVRSNVSVIDLSLFQNYVVSSEVFTLESSLVYLRLKSCCFDEYDVMNLKSLKTLHLQCVQNMTKKTLLKMISSCPLLETFTLINSTLQCKSTTLEIFHTSLKYLNVQECGYPITLELDVPKLLSLTCIDRLNEYEIRDLGGMGFDRLTKLSLLGYAGNFLADSCPKDDDGILLWSRRFPLLEDLTLKSCLIGNLKFHSQSLKRLFVEGCINLKVMNIDARKLVFFKYAGCMIEISNLIKSSQFEAELELLQLKPLKLRNLVKMFDDTRMLKITCWSALYVFIPEEMRPPLYHMKHLYLNLMTSLPEEMRYDELLWGLLKFSYWHEKISICLEGSRCIELKFQNVAEAEEEMNLENSRDSIKDDLIEVKLSNFEGDNKELQLIRTLFTEARILRTMSISLTTKGISNKAIMKYDIDSYPKLSPNVEYVFT